MLGNQRRSNGIQRRRSFPAQRRSPPPGRRAEHARRRRRKIDAGTFSREACAPGSSACPDCVRDVRPGAHGQGRGNSRRIFGIPRISLPALELYIYIYRVQLRTSRARARARARARTPPGGRAHAARQSDPAEDRVSREIAFFQGPPSILSGFRAFSLPAGIMLTPPPRFPAVSAISRKASSSAGLLWRPGWRKLEIW